MGSLLGAFILTFTVVMVFAMGIFSSYGVVVGILHTFASQSQRPATRSVLVSNQARAAHAGGD